MPLHSAYYEIKMSISDKLPWSLAIQTLNILPTFQIMFDRDPVAISILFKIIGLESKPSDDMYIVIAMCLVST